MGLFDSISTAVTGLFDSGSGMAPDATANAGLIGDLMGGLGSLTSFDPGTPAVLNGQGPSMNASSGFQSYPFPGQVTATSAMVPRIATGVGRWAMQFPSLWQALQRYRASGVAMSIPKLWRMFKNVGPSVLATYIGAAAVADLVTFKATHKNRRMNVANTHALRRSLRRLRGFERLSHRVSMQLARAAAPRRRSASRRCNVCRKSPCSC
jgi:hypothetical protein